MKYNPLFFMGMAACLIASQSCASFYAASGTIGITSIDNTSKVNQANLSSEQKDIKITYNVKKNKAIIHNNSDKTLYIDKAKSYYIDNNSISQSLFNNSVTTISSSSMAGSTVNLGAVAGALGVQGPIGTLANGINVGSASQEGISRQIIEQQYLVIPPFSSQILEIPNCKYYYTISGNSSFTKEYSFEDSPIKSQYAISYAFEEPNSELKFNYKRDGLYLSKEEMKKGRFRYALLSNVQYGNPFNELNNNYTDLQEFNAGRIVGSTFLSLGTPMLLLSFLQGPPFAASISIFSIGAIIDVICKSSDKSFYSFSGFKL